MTKVMSIAYADHRIEELNSAIRRGQWVHNKSSIDINKRRSRFVDVTYTCDGDYSHNGGADEYSFEIPTQEGLSIFDYPDLVDKLAGKNILLCGDSHMEQIYGELQAQLEEFIDKVDRRIGSGELETLSLANQPLGQFPHCHGNAKGISMFYDEPIHNDNCYYTIKSSSGCSRVGSKSRLCSPCTSLRTGSNNLTVTICSIYLRPLGAHNATDTCLDLIAGGVPQVHVDGSSKHLSFDSVVVNHYLDVERLRENVVTQNVIVVPKYDFGDQGYELSKHPRTIKAVPTSPKFRHELNLSPMLKVRSHAKKATYPFFLLDHDGNPPEICCKDMGANNANKCNCSAPEGAVAKRCGSYFVKHFNATCIKDSHFCIPGPLRDAAKLILNSLV